MHNYLESDMNTKHLQRLAAKFGIVLAATLLSGLGFDRFNKARAGGWFVSSPHRIG